MVWACIEKRRRIRREESDGDGGAREKKERKTKAEVAGYHQERLVGERIVRLSGEDVQDRAKWRRLLRHIDPT